MQGNEKGAFAPIVMFVYNRADHFEKTYQALSACPEAKDSDLFIFSDGAKNEKAEEGVLAVRKAIHAAETDGHFNSVTIVESSVNKGLEKSIIGGVSQVIGEYGEVIILEDDCVVSPYFLHYMNLCLDKYEGNSNVGSISGYAPDTDFLGKREADVFFAYRSCSMSWASWKDRWEKIDWSMSNLSEFYKHPALIKKLNSCGNDRFLRLYRQTRGNSSSWSIKFGANLILNDQGTVYPRYSYVENIGADASGVHSKAEDAELMRVDLSKAIAEPRLADVEYIPEIQKKMKKHYSGSALSGAKRFAATVAIVAKERLKRK